MAHMKRQRQSSRRDSAESAGQVEIYLGQAGLKKHLTREQQYDLVARIRNAQKKRILLLLANPIALRVVLSTLRKLQNGRLNPRSLLITGRGDESLSTVMGMLPKCIKALRRVLEADRPTFLRAMRQSASNAERRKVLKILSRRRRRAARLVLECHLRPARLEAAFAAIRDHWTQATRVRDKPNDGADPDSRTRLARLIIAAGEPYARLTRRLLRAEEAKNEMLGLREEFATTFLPFAVSIAAQYKGLGLTIGELVQEANIGLLIALDRFDVGRETMFSTYASWWIRQCVWNAIRDQSRTVRIPKHSVAQLRKLREIGRKLHGELGRESTPAELAEALGMTERKANLLLRSDVKVFSLDNSREEGNGFSEAVVESVDAIESSELTQKVERSMRLLNAQQQQVIRLRFGLSGEAVHTLAQAGRLMKLSRERVRQIEVAALNRLKTAGLDVFND